MNRKISVVMSAYNEPERFLRESIESILNQTYRDFEFIIIQDNPDNEAIERVVNEYAAKDSRIRFYKNEKNIGLAMSLNRGIELARYDIIARMDADDISLPERFEKELAYLDAHPEMHMVSINSIKIDENGNQVRESNKLPHNFSQTKRVMGEHNVVMHPGAMLYKKDFLEIGGYRNFPASQDYDLWLRYITNDWQIGFVQEVLIKYRISTNNTSMGNSLRQWACHKFIIKMYKERLKNGKDSFTEESLSKYLNDIGCNDPKSRDAFNKGHDLIFQGGTALRKLNFIKVSRCLKAAYASHPEMKEYTRFVVRNRIKRQIRNLIY